MRTAAVLAVLGLIVVPESQAAPTTTKSPGYSVEALGKVAVLPIENCPAALDCARIERQLVLDLRPVAHGIVLADTVRRVRLANPNATPLDLAVHLGVQTYAVATIPHAATITLPSGVQPEAKVELYLKRPTGEILAQGVNQGRGSIFNTPDGHASILLRGIIGQLGRKRDGMPVLPPQELAVLPVPPVAIPSPEEGYPEPDRATYEKYIAGGEARLDGQAFLRTRGGDIRTCAGATVYLDPATAYSDVWWAREAQNLKTWTKEPDHPLFAQARRTAKCSLEGKFRFRNLAPGFYFVRVMVKWESPMSVGSSSYLLPDGGLLGMRVEVSTGENDEAILDLLDTLRGDEG